MITKEQKIKFAEEHSKELGLYKTVGIISLDAVPDRLVQKVRNSSSNLKFISGRKSLLKRVLESNEETKPLAGKLSGTSAIVLSNLDPFEVYGIFKSHALKLPAKPKQIATDDIVVKSGETSLQPGQAVTELKKAGIDVQIQKGKVVIAKDKVLAQKGAQISNAAASALHTLGITPFTAMIEPKALLNNGIIFGLDVLKITKESLLADIADVFLKSRALALELGIVTPYTISELIKRAYLNAIALGVGANLYDTGIIERLIAKAVGEAHALGIENA